MTFGLLALAAIIVLAVGTDLKSRRIPNSLIVAGALAAAISQTLGPSGPGLFHPAGGAVGSTSALLGVAVGFAALFPLYALRAMGAGDVKLMMVIGAFLGPLQTLGVVVLTFAAGGLLALLMSLLHGSFARMVANLRFMLNTSAVRAAGGESPRFEPLQHTAGRMPYAVAIAAGTLLQFVLVRNGGWALG